jgi:hypothetical protein
MFRAGSGSFWKRAATKKKKKGKKNSFSLWQSPLKHLCRTRLALHQLPTLTYPFQLPHTIHYSMQSLLATWKVFEGSSPTQTKIPNNCFAKQLEQVCTSVLDWDLAIGFASTDFILSPIRRPLLGHINTPNYTQEALRFTWLRFPSLQT